MSLIRDRAGASIFLIVLSCYVYFFPRWADWNQNSRFDLTVALVDDHGFAIDRYVANTGDYALYMGHYYSDKAPGMALLGVPIYALFRVLAPDQVLEQALGSIGHSRALQATLNSAGTGVQLEKLRFFLGLVVTVFFVGALLAACLAVVFFWMIGCLGGAQREQIAGTLLYALATVAFPYSNSLVGHQTTASLLFIAFGVLFAIRRGRLGRAWLLGVGFLFSYAVITEYPAVLIVAVLGMYALVALHGRAGVLGRIALGAIPPLALLVVHDLGAFGTPLPVGYFYSALWTDVHQSGLVSLTYPHFDALWGISFSAYRGLFFLSPYLLLALPGYRELWRRGWPAEVVVLAAAPLLYFAYNSSSAMWSGGFGVGPRYLVAAVPFLALPAAAGLVWAWRQPATRPVLVLAAAWSAAAIWAETLGGQALPDYSTNPLFDVSLPRLAAGDVARNMGMIVGLGGWASVTPLTAFVMLVAIAAGTPRRARMRTKSTVARSSSRSATWAS